MDFCYKYIYILYGFATEESWLNLNLFIVLSFIDFFYGEWGPPVAP